MSAEFRYLVLTFASTHAVLAGERCLHTRGLEPEFIPVPREIDASCGFCLRLTVPSEPDARSSLLAEAGRSGPEGVWKIMEGASWKERRYERIDETD